MLGRDLPDGNFDELEASGAKQKADGSVVFKAPPWPVCIKYKV